MFACPVPLPTSPITSVDVVSAGHVSNDWSHVTTGGKAGPVDLPLLVGVIRHPGGVVLVDTGLPKSTRTKAYPPEPIASIMRPSVPEGQAIAERMAGTPIAKVLLTHAHFDHVGGLLDLPGVEAWLGAADWARYSPAPGQLGFGPRVRAAANWHPVDFAAGVAQRILDRPAIDVLGDQSIVYLSTPGHSPGSASVLVRARDAVTLFVGDTAWTDDHLGTGRRPTAVSLFVDAEPKNLDASLTWARDIKTRCSSVRVVPGHEPAWADGNPAN